MPKRILKSISIAVVFALVCALAVQAAFADTVADSIGATDAAGTDAGLAADTADASAAQMQEIHHSTQEEILATELSDKLDTSVSFEKLDAALAYIYTSNPEVASGQETNILVGLSDEGAQVQGATLIFAGPEEQILELQSVATLENSALFTFAAEEPGLWQATTLTYTLADAAGNGEVPATNDITFGQTVAPAVFVVPEGATGAVAYTLDDQGNITDAGNLEEVMDSLSAQAAESQGAASVLGEDAASTNRAPLASLDDIVLEPQANNVKIMLDPGHCSISGGCSYGGLSETILTLQIAQYCKAELEQYNGATVYMTRTSYDCPYPNATAIHPGLAHNLADICCRIDRAVELGCNVYVSIHINSGGGAGSEVWVQGGSSASAVASQRMGDRILGQLVGLGLGNRGVHTDNYRVTDYGLSRGIPSMIVEEAFIENNYSYLDSNADLQRLGVATATGIAKYYNLSKEVHPVPKVKSMADKSAVIGWDAVPGATSYTLFFHNANGTYTTIGKTSKITHTISGLTNGQTYRILVRAYVNGTLTSYDNSDDLKFVLSPSPKVTATATGDGQVTLSWPAMSNIQYYSIEEHYADGTVATVANNLPGSITSYVVKNLVNQNQHSFLVQACAGGVWSAESKSLLASATPQGPLAPSVSASASKNTVALSWNAISGATGYNVKCRQSDASSFTTLASGIKATSYTATNLVDGITYDFVVEPVLPNLLPLFADVPKTSWYASSVNYVASKGLMTGTNALFSPNAPITRGQLVTILFRAACASDPSLATTYATATNKGAFSDYNASRYYACAMDWAFDNGVIYGDTGKTTVRPNANVTRQEFAAILARYAVGGNVPKAQDLVFTRAGITDFATVAAWAKDSLSWAVYNGIMSGSGNTGKKLVKPLATTTRAEAAAMIANAYQTVMDFGVVSATPWDPTSPVVDEPVVGDGTVSLSWQPVQSATAYRVSLANPNGTYTLLQDGLTSRKASFNGLINKHAYGYLVQACVNGIWSSDDAGHVVYVTPQGAITPTTTATASKGQVSLSWTAVSGVTGYTVLQRCQTEDKYTQVATNITDTSYVATGLKDGYTYFFIVCPLFDEVKSWFTDLNTGAWYSQPGVLDYVISNNLIAGSKGAFDPQGKITRGQLITILFRDACSKNPSLESTYELALNKGNFPDYEKNRFYAKAIDWAYDNKIILGDKGTNKVRPNDNVSRQELAVILGRYAAGGKVDSTNNSVFTAAGIVDYATADAWALPSLSWAVKQGVMSGSGDAGNKKLAPKAFATRAEAAAMITTALRNVMGKAAAGTSTQIVTAKPTDPTAPSVTWKQDGMATVILTWKAVPGATAYSVEERTANGALVSTVANNYKSTSITIKRVTYDVTHYYLVQALVDGTWSSDSQAYYVTATLSAPNLYPVMGTSTYTATDLVNVYKSKGVAYPSAALSKGGAANIEAFCRITYEEAVAEGVRPEVLFAQMMYETGWLQFGGDVSVTQYNFGGLGATGGVPGLSFANVRTGIRAQTQHLVAYASTKNCVNTLVDPRFYYVSRGTAPYVQWLGGADNPYGAGWAVPGKGYGAGILAIIAQI